jgi:hypothetical protein
MVLDTTVALFPLNNLEVTVQKKRGYGLRGLAFTAL